jgi:hypothetical protein
MMQMDPCTYKSTSLLAKRYTMNEHSPSCRLVIEPPTHSRIALTTMIAPVESMDTSDDIASSPPSAKRQRLIAPAAPLDASSLAGGADLQGGATIASNEENEIDPEDTSTPFIASVSTTTNKNVSIVSTASIPVPAPQVVPVVDTTKPHRGPRELTSLGDVSFAESQSHAECFEPAERRRPTRRSRSTAPAGLEKPKSVSPAARNKSRQQESVVRKKARSKRPSTNSDATAPVVVEAPSSGLSKRRKTTGTSTTASSSVPGPATRAASTRAASREITEVDPHQRPSVPLGYAVIMALLSADGESSADFVKEPDDPTKVPGTRSLSADTGARAGASETVVQSNNKSTVALPPVGDTLIESSKSKTKELSVSHPQGETHQALRTESVETRGTSVTKMQTDGERETTYTYPLVVVAPAGTTETAVQSKAAVASPRTPPVNDSFIESNESMTKDSPGSHRAATVVEKLQGETSQPTSPKPVKASVTGLVMMKTNDEKETLSKNPDNSTDSSVAVPPDCHNNSTELHGFQSPPMDRLGETVVQAKPAVKSPASPPVEDSLIRSSESDSCHATTPVQKLQTEKSKPTCPMKTSGEEGTLSKNLLLSTGGKSSHLSAAVPPEVPHLMTEYSGLQSPPTDRVSETKVQSKVARNSPTVPSANDTLIESSESKTKSKTKEPPGTHRATSQAETPQATQAKPIEASDNLPDPQWAVTSVETPEAARAKPVEAPFAGVAKTEKLPDSHRAATSAETPQATPVEAPCADVTKTEELPDSHRAATLVETPQATPVEAPCADVTKTEELPDSHRAATSVETPQAAPVEAPCADVTKTEELPDSHRAANLVETPKVGTIQVTRVKPVEASCTDVTKTDFPEAHLAPTSVEATEATRAKPGDAPCTDVTKTKELSDSHRATISVETPKAGTIQLTLAKSVEATCTDVSKTAEFPHLHRATTSVETPQGKRPKPKPTEAPCTDVTKKKSNGKGETSVKTPLPTKWTESDYRFQPIRAKESPVKDTCANVVQESNSPTPTTFVQSTTTAFVEDTASAAAVASVTPDPVVIDDDLLLAKVEIISDQEMASFVEDTLCSGDVTSTQLPELWDTQVRGFLERFYVSDLDMSWESIGSSISQDPTNT